MSNSTTGKIWKLTAAGLIKSHLAGPVIIKHIIFEPNANADTFLLKYYDIETEIAAGVDEIFSESETGEISSTDTLTISGGTFLPSTIVDGSVFEIVRSSGLTANVSVPALVKTAGNDTAVTVHDDPWTDEASVAGYSWKTYTSYDFLQGTVATITTLHYPLDGNGQGYKLPNLLLETITSGAVLYILT